MIAIIYILSITNICIVCCIFKRNTFDSYIIKKKKKRRHFFLIHYNARLIVLLYANNENQRNKCNELRLAMAKLLFFKHVRFAIRHDNKPFNHDYFHLKVIFFCQIYKQNVGGEIIKNLWFWSEINPFGNEMITIEMSLHVSTVVKLIRTNL